MAKIRVTKPRKKKPEPELIEEEEPKKKKSDKWIGPPTYKYRYVASLQDTKELNLYHDFVQSNTLTEIKKKSEKEVADAFKEDGLDLGVLVVDRESWFDTYRYNLPAQPEVGKDHKGKVKVVNDTTTRIKSWVKDK